MSETSETTTRPETKVLMQVHFTDIKRHIITYLSKADQALVCAAWFTCPDILGALSKLGLCTLLLGEKPKSLHDIKEAKLNVYQYIFPVVESVFPTENTSRLHHKFIVLEREVADYGIQPYAVITGSYNFTRGAERNLENIVYIEDAEVARTYAKEFLRLIESSIKL